MSSNKRIEVAKSFPEFLEGQRQNKSAKMLIIPISRLSVC